MKFRPTLSVLSCLLLGSFCRSSMADGNRTPQFVPGEILVGLRSPHGPATVQSISKDAVERQITSVAGIIVKKWDGIQAYKVRLRPGLSIQQAIQRLNQTGAVAYAEPNYIRHICATPNDASYASQYA